MGEAGMDGMGWDGSNAEPMGDRKGDKQASPSHCSSHYLLTELPWKHLAAARLNQREEFMELA